MGTSSKIETAGQSSAVMAPVLSDDAPLSSAHRFASWLRDFSWLTAERVRFYAGVLLLAYLAAAALQLANSHQLMFKSGAVVGGDFVNPYAASIAALKGDPASVYDLHRQHLQQVAVMRGRDFGVLGFHYPPMFLLTVLPL